MLSTRLARTIFTVARAIPIVRTTRAIGPFWRANTCSAAVRTFDLAPFGRATFHGHGLPWRLLTVYMRDDPALGQALLVRLGPLDR